MGKIPPAFAKANPQAVYYQEETKETNDAQYGPVTISDDEIKLDVSFGAEVNLLLIGGEIGLGVELTEPVE